MDDEQLAVLEQGMRAALTEPGLDWVRANIEEGIAAGVQKEVLVRRSSRQQAAESLFDDEEFQYEELSTNGKGQRMIGNVRLGSADRVRMITQALRRLMVELPQLHEDAIKRLADDNDPATAVEDMRFLPDQDDTAEAPPSLDGVMTSQNRAAREAAAAFLVRLDDEASRQ
jgi:hypothetical protein